MKFSQLLINQHFAISCAQGSSFNQFFKFPTWYEYLPCVGGQPQLTSISGIWLIVAAIIDILLRVAAIIAVFLIIYAGIQYSTSRGEPDQTRKALNTIIYAAIGLIICILAAVIVTFIAGSF